MHFRTNTRLVICARLLSRRLQSVAATVTACILLIVFCGVAVGQETWKSDNGNGTFTNPLFYDEFSDPDMIRVGSEFYLTGTTMHAMPGLPVLHSRDLVNWEFVAYAMDRLDLGPAFRLEDGKQVYGQGIWAPCFRYHNGTFYIFSNVNGQMTQMFRAKNPAGPWTHTAMKKSFHDISVLFDDDGKAYVVWGYQDIHMAQLTDDLTDIVPGTELQIIAASQGMGEGLHLYKIRGKYYLTSAWYLNEMRMPVARADSLSGPWEVNQNVSRGEDFGIVESQRMDWLNWKTKAPFKIRESNPEGLGRAAMHQGGIVDTPTGEWWGFSMFEGNSVGRLTALSPVTWKDGWPYFGLPGNLGRTPRVWIKPDTGASSPPRAPYRHSDDFSGAALQPIWQWNHVPVDGQWSFAERPGYLRLHALPASDFLMARNTLTQRAVGPHSIATVQLDTAGMMPGDVAGFALLNRPYALLGVERGESGLTLIQVDEQAVHTVRVPLTASRVWLRADCDYLKEESRFSYSADGNKFQSIGEPFRTIYQLLTFQGVRYALFSYNVLGKNGGFADFDSITVDEPNSHRISKPIPFGKQIKLASRPDRANRWLAASGNSLQGTGRPGTSFTVVDRGLGRIALRSVAGFLSVTPNGAVTLRKGQADTAETFQWIETFTGELTLLSLSTNRYLRLDPATGDLLADSPGPKPNGKDGVRWDWSLASN